MVRLADKAGQMGLSINRERLAHSPFLVFFEMTQACDLACTHCRACAQTRPSANELSSAESLRLIDQLTQFPQPPMLILTGGDPLKRADVFELIQHAKRSGLDVSITPAATSLATADRITQLRDAGISRMAVSLDGASRETHDGLRGVDGSFQKTLEMLTMARDAGVATQVNTVVTRSNYQQISALAELLSRYDIALWSVFFLVPVGRAARDHCLDGRQCEAVFEELWQQTQRQPYLIKTTEAPHYRRFAAERRKSAPRTTRTPRGTRPFLATGLNDGKGVMFVSHSGLIHPSGFMPIVCGVFPFQHVVQVYQQSPVFQKWRSAEQLHGKCRQCEYRTICGGSRARAYAVTGDPLAEEPDCTYIPRGLR